jgi:hypothetical protein
MSLLADLGNARRRLMEPREKHDLNQMMKLRFDGRKNPFYRPNTVVKLGGNQGFVDSRIHREKT